MRIRDILATAFSFIPEGKPKEKMRGVIYKYYNDLYILDKITEEVEILDNEAVIKLYNGLSFHFCHSNKLQNGLVELKYADLKKLHELSSLKNAEGNFDSVIQVLIEQFVRNEYQTKFTLAEGDTIVDIGAHIGIFTVKAAKEVGNEGKVIAIEPEKENSKFLERNIQANRLSNVEIVRKAAWSKKGMMKLYLSSSQLGHTLIPREGNYIEVEVDTLVSILEELGIKKVDFVKIDAEGAEIEILKGAEQILESNGNIKVVLEARHKVNNEPTYETVVPYLVGKHFEVHNVRGTVHAKKISEI